MRDLGLKSELHVYEGKPHGFFNQKKGGVDTFLDTLEKMDAFLVEIGYIQGTPEEAQLQAVLHEKK